MKFPPDASNFIFTIYKNLVFSTGDCESKSILDKGIFSIIFIIFRIKMVGLQYNYLGKNCIVLCMLPPIPGSAPIWCWSRLRQAFKKQLSKSEFDSFLDI